MKKKDVDRLLKILLISVVIFFFPSLSGMLLTSELTGKAWLEEIDFSLKGFIFLAFLFYIAGEAFMIYYGKGLTLENIKSYWEFIKQNSILLLLSILFGVLFFNALYFVRNIGKAIPGMFSEIAGAIIDLVLAIGTTMKNYPWTIALIGIVILFFLIKYVVYLAYFEGRKR